MRTFKKCFNLFLSLALLFSTVISPNVLMNVSAETTNETLTTIYSHKSMVSVNNGTNAIDVSEQVDTFKALTSGSINITASVTNRSVSSLFFIGDSSNDYKYVTFYVNPNNGRLGIETYSEGNQVLHQYGILPSGFDATKTHKYSLVYNSKNQVKLYVDGTLIKEATVNIDFISGVVDSANYVAFGRANRLSGTNNYLMSGSIGNIEVYNSAISEEKVIEYANSQRDDLVYSKTNIYCDGITKQIDTNENAIQVLLDANESTINICYSLRDSSVDNKVTLFSLSDNTSDDNYFRIWINPVQGVVGTSVNGIDYICDDTNNVVNKFTDGNWHTLTYVQLNNGNSAIYVDGIQVYSGADLGGIASLTRANTIGNGCLDLHSDTFDQVSKVAIQSVVAYNSVISEPEILEEANKIAFNGGMVLDGGYRSDDMTLYYPGYEGSSGYRIPAIIKTQAGTILTGVDQRRSGTIDCGNINLAVRRQEAGKQNFDEAITVVDLVDSSNSSGFFPFVIDMNLVQDQVTGRIFMFTGMFPQSGGLYRQRELIQQSSGYKEINGKKYQGVYTNNSTTEFGTIRENGVVYDTEGNKTDYRVITKCEAPYKELGNIYKNGEYRGNAYVFDGDNAGDFQIMRTHYLWMTYSDDDGKSWSCPKDITPQVKEDWMMFIGTGPGRALQMKDGTLIVPVYTAGGPNGSVSNQASAIIKSEDHGETWVLGESPVELYSEWIHREDVSFGTWEGSNKAFMLTESQAIQMNNGKMILFMRNQSGSVYAAISDDKGMTWSDLQAINLQERYCMMGVIHYTKGNEEYIAFTKPKGSAIANRSLGTMYLGKISLSDTNQINIEWIADQTIFEDKFEYSCLTLLDETTTLITPDNNRGARDILADDVTNPKFGIFYEDFKGSTMRLKYTVVDEEWVKADLTTATQGEPKLLSKAISKEGNTYKISMTYDQIMMITGDASLIVKNQHGDSIKANYQSGSATNTIVFTLNLNEAMQQGIVKVIGIDSTNATFENTIGIRAKDDQFIIEDYSKLEAASVSATSQHSNSTAEGSDGAAINVIDGNPNTYWHSNYNSGYSLPQSITINLGSAKTINKAVYLPRQNSNSGRVRDYIIEVSTDNSSFTKVAFGTFETTTDEQVVSFLPTSAQYVKLTINSSTVSGSCAVAEFNVYEYLPGTIDEVSFDRLNEAIQLGNAKTKGKYTRASIGLVNDEITKAQALIKNSNGVPQSIVDVQTASLRNAIQALVGTNIIEEKIASAQAYKESLNQNDYTTSSWNSFVTALTDANEYQQDTNQKAVTDKYMRLDAAKEGLILKSQSIDFNILLSNTKLKAFTAGTNVGSLSTSVELEATQYELINGNGDTNNGLFEIEGNTLKVKSDLENKQSYHIRIKATSGISSKEQVFTIKTNDLYLIFEKTNIEVSDGISLTDEEYGQDLLEMQEGTFFVEYTSNSSNGVQSLLSIGNSGVSSTHVHLYITPGGSLGSEVRNGNIFSYNTASIMRADNVVTSGKNRVALKADRDNKTYKLFANGQLVKTIDASTLPQGYKFVSDLDNANNATIGTTIRSNVNQYKFGGTIHNIRAYGVVLSDEELCSMTNLETTIVDKTQLVTLINRGESKQADDYTAESYAVLTSALTSACSVNNDANATQAEVDDAVKALADAIKGLIDKPVVPSVDKKALVDKINEAKAISTEGKTEESAKALADAIKDGETVNNDANATQAEVNDAVKVLDDAIKGLVDKPVVTPVDKTNLDNAIKRASIYIEERLSAEDKVVYSAALSAAQAVLANENATEKEIEDAVTTLREAINNVDSNMSFPDVKKDAWYYGVVDEAFARGLMGPTDNKKNTFSPDWNISRGMVATVLYRMAGAPNTTYVAKFPDVKEGEWYSNAIIWANNAGIINGYGDGNFGADNNITREQLAIMLRNYAMNIGKLDVNANADLSQFKDEKAISSYAVSAVKWAVANHIISGKGGTSIAPIENATRGECAKMFMMLQDLVVE